ncbi:MAG: isocitrate lyase/PEP mutase family protein [Burkholderiaceae bacterium]
MTRTDDDQAQQPSRPERSDGRDRQRGPARLRALLAAEQLVIAPGAYDCIPARLIVHAGFAAAYMTGAGTAAALGYPDYGLTTLTEMADNAGRIAAAIGLPLIADADTGFGNELNVVRTVREYERRGVAGLHIEDQSFPKKCGHLENKTVIDRDAFLTKIRAAVDARTDADFVIIARTDARAMLGLDEAIARANAALAVGADIAFVEATQNLDEVAAVPRRVEGPCLLNLVWRGKTPEVPFDEARQMGYRVAILPGLLFKAVMATSDRVLAETRSLGRHASPGTDMTPQEGFNRVGAAEWDAISKRYGVR